MLSKHPAQPSRTLAGTILKDNRDSLHLFPHTDMHRFTASFARLQLVSSFPQQRNLYWNLSETICSRGEKKMLCGKYLAICLCLDFTKFKNYCLQLLCFHKTEEKTGGGSASPATRCHHLLSPSVCPLFRGLIILIPWILNVGWWRAPQSQDASVLPPS